MSSAAATPRRFAITLSFPGEHRDYVEQVAKALLPAFGGEEQGKARVFYDAWHEGKVIGYASNRKLQKIYAKDSDLIVPFYCQDYLNKKWCGVELRAIEELLFNQQNDRVLPFRFDMVDIPSSFKTDVFPVVTHRPPAEIARLILERYNELQQTTLKLPESPASRQTASPPADLSRILKYAPAELIGRQDETQLLSDAWDKAVRAEKGRPHILTLWALGGEGKTALVAKWAAELAAQDWPGCDAAFAWSFYSQGTREQQAASSDLFFKEALTFFGDDADKQFAASPAGSFEKGQRLARLVGQRRSLLILDGLEPLQYAPTAPTPGELRDQGLAALLKGLAAASHGLCVATTRYSLPDLRAFWQTTAPELNLLRLSRALGLEHRQTLARDELLYGARLHAQIASFEPVQLRHHGDDADALTGAQRREARARDFRRAHEDGRARVARLQGKAKRGEGKRKKLRLFVEWLQLRDGYEFYIPCESKKNYIWLALGTQNLYSDDARVNEN